MRSLMQIRTIIPYSLAFLSLFLGACGEQEQGGEDEIDSAAVELENKEVEDIDTLPDNLIDTAGETLDIPAEDSSAAEMDKPVTPSSLKWKLPEGAGSVRLTINGKDHVVLPEVTGGYVELEKGDFQEAGVPSGAALAAMSIEDGGGAIIYAEIKGESLLIYRKGLADMSEGEGTFKEVKRIAL